MGEGIVAGAACILRAGGRRTSGVVGDAKEHQRSALESCVGEEDRWNHAMAPGKTDMNLSRLAQHTGCDIDEGVAEALPLPAHRLSGQRQLREPGLEIVGAIR